MKTSLILLSTFLLLFAGGCSDGFGTKYFLCDMERTTIVSFSSRTKDEPKKVDTHQIELTINIRKNYLKVD